MQWQTRNTAAVADKKKQQQRQTRNTVAVAGKDTAAVADKGTAAATDKGPAIRLKAGGEVGRESSKFSRPTSEVSLTRWIAGGAAAPPTMPLLDGSSGMPAPAPGTDPALPAGSRRCQLGAGVADWDPALPDGPGVAGWDSEVLARLPTVPTARRQAGGMAGGEHAQRRSSHGSWGRCRAASRNPMPMPWGPRNQWGDSHQNQGRDAGGPLRTL